MDYSGKLALDSSHWDHSLGLIEITLINKEIFRQMFMGGLDSEDNLECQRFILDLTDNDAKMFIKNNYAQDTPKVIIRESQGSKYGLFSATVWYPVDRKFANYRFGVLYKRKYGIGAGSIHYALVGLDNTIKGTREELMGIPQFGSLWEVLKWHFSVDNLLDCLITKKEWEEVHMLRITGELSKFSSGGDPSRSKHEKILFANSLLEIPEELLKEVLENTSRKSLIGGFGGLAVAHKSGCTWLPYKISFIANGEYKTLFVGIRKRRKLFGKTQWKLICSSKKTSRLEEYGSASELVARELPCHQLLSPMSYNIWKDYIKVLGQH